MSTPPGGVPAAALSMERVVINTMPLLSRRSGIGVHLENTCRALAEWDPLHRASYYDGKNIGAVLRDRMSSTYHRMRPLARLLSPWVYPAYLARLERRFSAQVRGRFDLYHETGNAILPFPGKTVVTVYDLSPLHHPETHPRERVKRFHRYFLERLSWAAHHLTLSEFVKKEMEIRLGIPGEKITVVGAGVGSAYRPLAPEAYEIVTGRYGVSRDGYILALGTLEPRKNIPLLLEAYALLPVKWRRSFPLVLAGGEGWLWENLSPLLDRLGIRSQVKMLGYVPQEDLPALLGACAVFAFPSVYEGFGLPPLEAMACGRPVLVSNAASLPEVVGPAGGLVPPDDAGAWRGALLNLLEDPGERDRWGRRGLERAKEFGWSACAARTWTGYGRAFSASSER